MKKILASLIILISLNSFGQTGLDTIRVRNLNLRAEEWYWLKGMWRPSSPLEKETWKKMRNKLTADNPPTNATIVTIDSIPGSIALYFYETFLQASKGQTSFMSNNISQNIRAYTPMLPYTNAADSNFQGQFQNTRKNGKDDFDN